MAESMREGHSERPSGEAPFKTHPRRCVGQPMWMMEAVALAQACSGRVVVVTQDKPHNRYSWITSSDLFTSLEALEDGARLSKDSSMKQENMVASMTASVGSRWQRQRRVLTQRVLPAGIGGERVLGIAARFALHLDSNLDSMASTASSGCVVTDIKELLASHVGNALVEMILGVNTGDFTRQFLYNWAQRKGPNGEQTLSFFADMPESTDYTIMLAQLLEKRITQRAAGREALAPGTCSLMEALVHDLVDSEQASRDENYLLRGEVEGNLVSFLTAGFETTFSVVLWTVIALGSDKHQALRKHVQAECELLESSEELRSEQLDLLRNMKKAAMSGAPLPPSLYEDRTVVPRRDLLVRCIAETLTMFPPVWSLPRQQAQQNSSGGCLFSMLWRRQPSVQRMDGRPLSMNGVQPDWPMAWNPLRPRPPASSIHAFGVGERACPAGTAALIIAWTLLRTMLRRWEFVEAEQGAAVASAYLRPVLLTNGPQLVRITAATGR